MRNREILLRQGVDSNLGIKDFWELAWLLSEPLLIWEFFFLSYIFPYLTVFLTPHTSLVLCGHQRSDLQLNSILMLLRLSAEPSAFTVQRFSPARLSPTSDTSHKWCVCSQITLTSAQFGYQPGVPMTPPQVRLFTITVHRAQENTLLTFFSLL